MRRLILSDLHWNNPASRARRLLPFLAHYLNEVDQVVLNGDTLEYCVELSGKMLRAKEEISCALAARNGPPLFLTGNNDPAISDQHTLYIEEAALLVVHGDIIVGKAPTWNSYQRDVRREYIERTAADSHMSLEERAAILRDAQQRRMRQQLTLFRDKDVEPKVCDCLAGLDRLLELIGLPWEKLAMLSYLLKAPRLLVDEVHAHLGRPVRRICCGHTHWTGEWKINGVEVINTGSPMPFSRMTGVIVDGDTVRTVYPTGSLPSPHKAPPGESAGAAGHE